MEKIKDLMTQHGIRPTYQRLVIYRYLNEMRNHPDVDSIYLNIIDDVPTISRTTVYNTVHLFVKKGLVKEISVPGSQSHYDIIERPHHHFICKKCGRIFDLPGECCFHSTGFVNGHKIEEMEGYFMGICEKCLKKGE